MIVKLIYCSAAAGFSSCVPLLSALYGLLVDIHLFLLPPEATISRGDCGFILSGETLHLPSKLSALEIQNFQFQLQSQDKSEEGSSEERTHMGVELVSLSASSCRYTL